MSSALPDGASAVGAAGAASATGAGAATGATSGAGVAAGAAGGAAGAGVVGRTEIEIVAQNDPCHMLHHQLMLQTFPS